MFKESNTIEQMILNVVTKLGGKQASMVRKDTPPDGGESPGDELRPALWTYASSDQVSLQLIYPQIVHGQCSTRDRE